VRVAEASQADLRPRVKLRDVLAKLAECDSVLPDRPAQVLEHILCPYRHSSSERRTGNMCCAMRCFTWMHAQSHLHVHVVDERVHVVARRLFSGARAAHPSLWLQHRADVTHGPLAECNEPSGRHLQFAADVRSRGAESAREVTANVV